MTTGEPHRRWWGFILCVVIGLACSCAYSTYRPFYNSKVYPEGSGSVRPLKGIDVWEYGVPTRPYRIRGIIALPYSGNGLLAVGGDALTAALEAKKNGADAIVLVDSEERARAIDSKGGILYDKKMTWLAINYAERTPAQAIQQPPVSSAFEEQIIGRWLGRQGTGDSPRLITVTEFHRDHTFESSSTGVGAESDQKVQSRGTWSLEGKRLTLTVTESSPAVANPVTTVDVISITGSEMVYRDADGELDSDERLQ